MNKPKWPQTENFLTPHGAFKHNEFRDACIAYGRAQGRLDGLEEAARLADEMPCRDAYGHAQEILALKESE